MREVRLELKKGVKDSDDLKPEFDKFHELVQKISIEIKSLKLYDGKVAKKNAEEKSEKELELKRIIQVVNDGQPIPELSFEIAFSLLTESLIRSYLPIISQELFEKFEPAKKVEAISMRHETHPKNHEAIPIKKFLDQMEKVQPMHFHIISRVIGALVWLMKPPNVRVVEEIETIFAYALIRTSHHHPVSARFTGANDQEMQFFKSMMTHFKTIKSSQPQIKRPKTTESQELTKTAMILHPRTIDWQQLPMATIEDSETTKLQPPPTETIPLPETIDLQKSPITAKTPDSNIIQSENPPMEKPKAIEVQPHSKATTITHSGASILPKAVVNV